MTWSAPHHWQEGLVDAMCSELHDRDMTSADVSRRGGPGHRHMWSWGNINHKTGKYSLPTVRTLIGWCAIVGVKPSDLLRRAGL